MGENQSGERCYTVSQIAKLLSVDESTVHCWCVSGEIGAIDLRLSLSQSLPDFRIPHSAYLEFLESRKVIKPDNTLVQAQEQMSQSKPIMSVTEVSKFLSVSRDKVLYWIHTEKLVASNIGEGKRPRWKIKLEDVNNFLNARTNQTPERVKKQPKRTVRKWF